MNTRTPTNPFDGIPVAYSTPNPTRPGPSVKQMNFIADLARERGVDVPVEQITDKAIASQWIEKLLKMPPNARGGAIPPPEGIHAITAVDGAITILKVQRSSIGHLYTKTLQSKETGGGWLYTGKAGLDGLSEDTLLTLEKAKEYGQIYGVCCRCSALLTDEKSVMAGIGPVCATKF